MKEKIFIDTGFWIALFNKDDEYHQIAKKNFKSILKNYWLYSSEFIMFETITYLNCSIKNHDLALKFLDRIESNNFVTIFEVDIGIKNKALEIFKKYADQYFSHTDCTSFAIMQQEKFTQYAGFDDHFKSMGFYAVF